MCRVRLSVPSGISVLVCLSNGREELSGEAHMVGFYTKAVTLGSVGCLEAGQPKEHSFKGS